MPEETEEEYLLHLPKKKVLKHKIRERNRGAPLLSSKPIIFNIIDNGKLNEAQKLQKITQIVKNNASLVNDKFEGNSAILYAATAYDADEQIPQQPEIKHDIDFNKIFKYPTIVNFLLDQPNIVLPVIPDKKDKIEHTQILTMHKIKDKKEKEKTKLLFEQLPFAHDESDENEGGKRRKTLKRRLKTTRIISYSSRSRRFRTKRRFVGTRRALEKNY